MDPQENLINQFTDVDIKEPQPSYVNQAQTARLMPLKGMCTYDTDDGYEFMLTIDDNKFLVRKV